MEVIKDIGILKGKLERLGKNSVGLIYTKGALHDGHRTLIQAARKENFLVILANVLMPQDLEGMATYEDYPRSTAKDEELASLAGADFFFKPDPKLLESDDALVSIRLGTPLAEELNGQDRPNYYENKLMTIVKLLNIIEPKNFYMSDKDIQEIYFVEQLLKQFKYDCRVKVLPAVRDENQVLLGVSNIFLKTDESKQVAEIYKVLLKAQAAYEKGMFSSRKLKWHIENELSKLYLCKLIFVEIVEPERLRKIETITDEAIIMIGLRVGKINMYDHIILNKKEKGQ